MSKIRTWNIRHYNSASATSTVKFHSVIIQNKNNKNKRKQKTKERTTETTKTTKNNRNNNRNIRKTKTTEKNNRNNNKHQKQQQKQQKQQKHQKQSETTTTTTTTVLYKSRPGRRLSWLRFRFFLFSLLLQSNNKYIKYGVSSTTNGCSCYTWFSALHIPYQKNLLKYIIYNTILSYYPSFPITTGLHYLPKLSVLFSLFAYPHLHLPPTNFTFASQFNGLITVH